MPLDPELRGILIEDICSDDVAEGLAEPAIDGAYTAFMAEHDGEPRYAVILTKAGEEDILSVVFTETLAEARLARHTWFDAEVQSDVDWLHTASHPCDLVERRVIGEEEPLPKAARKGPTA